jgi:membrane fusion protein, multidrug efflux system
VNIGWTIVRLLSGATLCAGCHSEGGSVGATAADAPKGSPPTAAVQVSPARIVPLERALTAYGTVEFSPEDARVYSVQGEGRVVDVRVTAGQDVPSGTVLLKLELTPNAQLELERAGIDVEFAQKEYERLVGLRERELATNAEVQAAEKALAVAHAALTNVRRRQVDEGERVVRTLRGGVVLAVNVQLGQVVPAGTALVTIANRERLRVRLGIEQEDLAVVHPGEPVRVRPLNVDRPVYRGVIERIQRQVDLKTRLAEAVVPLNEPAALLPGAIVRAEVVVAENPRALVVPRSAVLYQQDKPYAFVLEESQARLRWLTVGEDNGQVIEVREGLRAGDPVVTLGNAQLQDGMAVRVETKP